MNWVELANVLSATALAGALNSLWMGLLLTALAAAVLRTMPRSNATTRYTVWFVTLLLIVALPVASPFIPRTAVAPAPISTTITAAPVTVPVTAEWPLYLGLAWAAISAILLSRIAWSLFHIYRLKHSATLIGRRENIRVLASPDVRVPMAAGFFRRAVLFPDWLVRELTPEEFEQVLCHEIAHLRRADDWTQLLHALVQALLFFHPAVHWIGRRLRIEREIACDDWVVSSTGKARPYAACLTHLHELTRRGAAPQLAPGAVNRKRWQITARVEALLEPGRNATPRFARSGWLAACAVLLAGFVVATQTVPPVGVQPLPIASIQMSRWNPPAAPAVAVTPTRPAQRPRLMAVRHLPKSVAAEAPVIEPDAGYMLVRAWQVEASPQYLIITVVFFAPPPPLVLTRI
ncbi:MAG: M56 family metallopeptidase [Bryobacteraceae bacterium]